MYAEVINIVLNITGIVFLLIVAIQVIITMLEIAFDERKFYNGLSRVLFPFMSFSYPPIMRRLVQFVHDKGEYHYLLLPGDKPRITRKNVM